MPSYNNEALTNGDGLANIVIGSGTPPPGDPAIFAMDDIYPIIEDGGVQAIGNVLANDTGLVGASVSVNTDVSNGNLVNNGDGTFTYEPDADFSGTDTFSYVATLAGESYPANVMLKVSFVNDAPVANADGPYTNTVGSAVAVDAAHGVLSNDSDVDGDTLSAMLDAAVPGLTLNGDGSFAYTGASTTFSYHANDGAANSNSIVVAINVGTPSNIALNVTEPDGTTTVDSYRWIVQEDATFHIDPPHRRIRPTCCRRTSTRATCRSSRRVVSARSAQRIIR